MIGSRFPALVALFALSTGSLLACSSAGPDDQLTGAGAPTGSSADAGSGAAAPAGQAAADASLGAPRNDGDGGGGGTGASGGGATSGSRDGAGADASSAADASAGAVAFHSAIQPSYATSLCLDAPGGNPSDGAQTELDACGSSSQELVFLRGAGGTYTITTSDGSLCLDALAGGSNTQTINVEETACSGSFTQSWRVVPGPSSGTFGVTTVDGTGCLDVDGAGSSPGTQLLMWPCSGTAEKSDEAFVFPGGGNLVPSGSSESGVPQSKPGCTTTSWDGFGSGFASSYCTSCHSNFGSYPDFAEYGAMAVEQIGSGLMPQPGSPQPSSQDVETLKAWVACGSPQ